MKQNILLEYKHQNMWSEPSVALARKTEHKAATHQSPKLEIWTPPFWFSQVIYHP